jgi:hypothetical protein
MKSYLLSGLLIVAVASLGGCGPDSDVPEKPPLPDAELETITLMIEGMS